MPHRSLTVAARSWSARSFRFRANAIQKSPPLQINPPRCHGRRSPAAIAQRIDREHLQRGPRLEHVALVGTCEVDSAIGAGEGADRGLGAFQAFLKDLFAGGPLPA